MIILPEISNPDGIVLNGQQVDELARAIKTLKNENAELVEEIKDLTKQLEILEKKYQNAESLTHFGSE